MSETNLCPHCSSEVPAGAKFCASCGKSLSSAPSAPAPSAPAPVYPAATPPSAAKSKAWMWVVGVIGLCLVCVLLIAGIYAVGNLTGMDLPNPFATKTPTPTNTPTQTPTPTITPTPTLGIGSTRMRIKDGMLEVYIPEGSFMMGSDSGDSDEKPVHQVTLDAYWIDQTEVTVGMYRACVDAGVCAEPEKTSSETHSSYFYSNTYNDYPVVYVTWYNAIDYCEWVGGRLPTEAEWEKAARGDKQIKYPWGNATATNQYANYGNNIGDVDRVGSYPMGASPYGLLDMAGNAYEWVFDVYDSDYYASSPSFNPTGPTSGDRHTLRGASFDTTSSTIRAANRGSYPAGNTGNDDGFRCAGD